MNETPRLRPKERDAILQSLRAGVVPGPACIIFKSAALARFKHSCVTSNDSVTAVQQFDSLSVITVPVRHFSCN